VRRSERLAQVASRRRYRLVRERFSVVLKRMVLELRGVACIGLEEVTPDRKSLVASRSFGQAVGQAESTLREWTASKRAAAPPAGTPSEAGRAANGALGGVVNGDGTGRRRAEKVSLTPGRSEQKRKTWKQTAHLATLWE